MNALIVLLLFVFAVVLYVFTISFGFTRCKKCKSWSTWKDVSVSYDDHRPNLRFLKNSIVCSKCRTTVADLGTRQEVIQEREWERG